tara:strand:+ start:3318 stop:3572 length:255 start_codon:yes stop_codon:yes gene_type:complete
MIRDFKSDLLETNLFSQTIVELLIEKEILTKEEVEERLIENQKLFMKLANEFAKLIIQAEEIKRKVKPSDEELLDMYFGPVGDA